jgi:CelD/BcsL family acetyltransferase involved in cellulose biosynthesis
MALSTTLGLLPPEVAAWDALCDATGATPFQRPSWVLPWFAAFSPADAYFAQVFDDGRLVGVLPLRRRLGVVRSATNWHTPLFASVATSDIVEDALIRAAARGSMLLLRLVPEGSSTAAAFARVCRDTLGMSTRSRTLLRSPRVEIAEPWAEYEKRLSKTMLKTLRRRARRLEEIGSVEFEVITEPVHAEAGLQEGLALEAAGWKGRRETAIMADAKVQQFYVEMALGAAHAGRLSLAFLRLGGRAVAFHLDLVDNGVLYGLKSAYAEDLSYVSPSRILRHERIKRAFAEGFNSYEFLGADEPYKAEWANAARSLEALEAYSPTPIGQVLQFGNTRGRRQLRRLLVAQDTARGKASHLRQRMRIR